MKFNRIVLALFAMFLVVGCDSTPPTKTAPVDVAGKVSLPDGKPATNVTLLILPTTSMQNQVSFSIKADGKFDVKLSPGKYTFVFEGNAASLKAIPTKYHTNNAEHTIEIPDAGEKALEIKLTN